MSTTWPRALGSGPLGLQPSDRMTARVVNNTGSATLVGELVMFDMALAGDATNFRDGDALSAYTSVRTPATAGLLGFWFGICLEAVADGAEMEVVLKGRVPALVKGTNAAALGDALSALNGDEELDSDVIAAGEKILGFPEETSAAGTAELIDIIFNGIEGFGNGA